MPGTYEVVSRTLQGPRRSGTSKGVLAEIPSLEDGSLAVSQSLPPFAEIARQGDGWTIQTATLFAPIAAYPSTTARLEIFNNRPGYSLVVADVFMAQVLATDADEAWGLFAMVTTRKAAPTNTALALASVSGKAAITTTAAGNLITAVDTTVVANGWRPWGSGLGFGNAAATPGAAMSAEVNGKLLVPYQCSLAIAPAGSIATASSFQCGATVFWVNFTPEGV